MLGWLAGPSKGLLLIGKQNGYLPLRFQQVNEHGIQVNILVAQGMSNQLDGVEWEQIDGALLAALHRLTT